MIARRLVRQLRRYIRGEDGIAAVEFAIWLTVLVPTVVNAVDLSVYAFDQTQVTNAAQAAAQAAWATATNSNACTTANGGLSTSSPPRTSCSGLSTAMDNAIKQSSVLGAASPAQITENTSGEAYGYYCPAATTYVLTSTSGATTCPGTSANSGATAGFYYKVEVTFTYTPLFGGATVTSLLSSTMTRDTWIRLQ